jgi:hypothetical protein
MVRPNSTVRPVHFEDFDGREFERLAFAYHVRAGWRDVAWYGEGGADGGRDIVGTALFDDAPPRRTVVQCANRAALTTTKVTDDIRKVLAAPEPPQAFRFICRGRLSAAKRDALKAAANALGVEHFEAWSGADFEEHLRLIGEDLLRRFFAGEHFPLDAEKLRALADDYPGLSDQEVLGIMAAVFDRPAFRTPFHQESSLPAFLKAIEDTISALNTGVWRTRDGDEVRRIPSLHTLRDPALRAGVSRTVQAADRLRRVFMERVRDGSIRHCSCGVESCSTFTISAPACQELDETRTQLLEGFRRLYPSFSVHLR